MIKLEDLQEEQILENHVWKHQIVENIEYIQKSNTTEISENSEESYIVLTHFHFKNGQKYNGYCSPQDTSGIDYIQPVLFTDKGQFAFYKEDWSEKEMIEFLSFLELSISEIFPIQYETKIMCDGKFYIGNIELTTL